MTPPRHALDGRRRRLAALLAVATGVATPLAVGTLVMAGSADATAASSYTVAVAAGGGSTTPVQAPGATATSAALGAVGAVAVDAAGTTYIADTTHGLVEKLSGSTLTVIANTGLVGPATSGAALTSSTPSAFSPTGVAVKADGTILYVADAANHRVVSMVPTVSSPTWTAVAGTGSAASPTPGAPTGSALHSPAGLALNGDASALYIADTGNNQVEQVTLSGTAALAIVAGTGTPAAAVPGSAVGSPVNQPADVAVDASGALYIADAGNNAVDKVTAPGMSGATLSIAASSLAAPSGVAVDASGSLWIADTGNHRVATVSGGTTTAVTTSPTLTAPAAIAMGASGHVVVADGSSVLDLQPVGGPTAPHITSTVPTLAALNKPFSLTVTASGFPIPTLSEIGTLPAGLTWNASTGVLSGTPTAATTTTPPTPFTLRAENSAGHEDQVVTLVVGAPPGAPTTPTAVRGAGSASLTWKAPTVATTDPPLTGFVITPMVGTTAGKPVTVSATATSATLTGLTAGSAYTFTIAATNKFGTGASVTTTAPVTPYGGPVAPAAGTHRYDGAGRVATAVGVSQSLFPTAGSAQVVVVASSSSYADALAGARLASAESAPLLLTSGSSLSAAVAGEVSRLLGGAGTVYLLGGTSTVSDSVMTALKAVNTAYTVTRISGANRYETAVAIAAQITKDTGSSDDAPIYLASGTNYPDGLAVSALAARTGGLVLLTSGATMPKATADYLAANDSDGTRTVPVGGPAAAAAGPGAAARAIDGANRYETSRLVAAHFADPAASATPVTSVGLATGANWPDALVGAAAMGDLGGPLLLTPGDHLDATVPAALSALSHAGKPTTSLVFGGSDTVADSTASAFATALTGH